MQDKFFRSGEHWVWLNAGAIAICLVLVIGLLLQIAVNGMAHFWPHSIATMEIKLDDQVEHVAGTMVDDEIAIIQGEQVPQTLIRVGNRDVYGQDFRWVADSSIHNVNYPEEIVAIERSEWGHFYGVVVDIESDGQRLNLGEQWQGKFDEFFTRAEGLHERVDEIESNEVRDINHELEELRLEERRMQLNNVSDPVRLAEIEEQRKALQADFGVVQDELGALYQQLARDVLIVSTAEGRERRIPFEHIVRLYQPNGMNILQKIGHYFAKVWEFLSEEPRESNTEGGVFPAIFGTVTMVLLMSIIVTPFGVIAAVYLSEYAKQGTVVRIIRIAVNNLAGVPSIVYGVFGLGFFVYYMGGAIDNAFFPEAKPAPTFGTSGLLWASLTLALLTLPVVIVSTEEGLARIPKAIREGSLALGATKIETLWRTVLPMASPAMMTGLILAVARAAGEVAPLMLVGVVKLAPTLPIDATAPFLHLERKFMHLGFHIYDVGFQSPNVEAARPLVYASALLLVAVTILLNVAAIKIRNRLREKYKSLEH